MKKNIFLLMLSGSLFLLYFGFIFSGCKDSTVDSESSLEPFNNNYLFVECSIVTDGKSLDNRRFFRDGGWYSFDKENYTLSIMSEVSWFTNPGKDVKYLIGNKSDLSRNIGGGQISYLTGLEKFSMVDSLHNEPFSAGYKVELLSCDKEGNVEIKLNDKLISLRLKEAYADSFSRKNCIIPKNWKFESLTDHLTITNYGFIQKKDVKYGW